MGCELMIYYPLFLKTIRRLDRALEELVDGPDWTIEDVLLEDAQTSRINEAEFSQPLCTAVQIGIVELLAHWEIQPICTVGHSSGEIAAAFAAGLISATEAIIVAYYRGLVVRDLNTNGAMLAVGLGSEDVQKYINEFEGKVVIGCHNSPASVTLSGDREKIGTIESKLLADKVFTRSVKTGGKAYHSYHMETVSSKYRDLILKAKSRLAFDPPVASNATMVSSVTNSKFPAGSVVDQEYWCKNLVSPVLFNQAVQTIATDKTLSSVDLLIEIGPHSALSGPVRQICIAHKFDKLRYLPTLIRNEDAAAQLLKLAGELYIRNYKFNMKRIICIETMSSKEKLISTYGSVLVDLPTYQWNYAKKLWAEPRQSIEHRRPRHDRHDILGRRVFGDSAHNPNWRNVLRIRDVPWLRHHSLGGEAVFPAAGYFSMAMEAITQLNEDRPYPVLIHGYVLRDISIKTALVTPDDDNGVEVVFSMQPSVHSDIWWDFNVSSVSSEGHWKDHMTGTIAINAREKGQKRRSPPNLPQRASGNSWNQALKEVGFDYGATFRDMENIQSDGKTFAAAAETTLKQQSGIMIGESRHVLHPSTVDSCLQLIIVSIYAGRINDMKCGAVPIQVDEIAIWPPTAEQLACKKVSAFSWTDQRGIRSFVSGSELVTQNGDVLMDIKNMRCVAYEAAAPPRLSDATKIQPYTRMTWKQDLDLLAPTHSVDDLDVGTLVNLLAHKKSNAKVLLLGCRNTEKILIKSPLLHFLIAETSDEALVISQQLATKYKYANAQRISLSVPLEEQIPVSETFDLIITSEGLHVFDLFHNIHKRLSSSGRFALEKVSAGPASAEFLKTFSCFDIDFESSNFVLSTVVDTNLSTNDDAEGRKCLIIFREKANELVVCVEETAKDLGWSARLSRLETVTVRAGEHVILLTDLEEPLLGSLKENELRALQHISSEASSILWITCGTLMQGGKPEHAMAAGLARSLTSENALLDLITLDFDLGQTRKGDMAKMILAIAEKQLHKDSSRESEYYVSNGVAHISRLEPLKDLNLTYAERDVDVENFSSYNPDSRLSGKVQSGKVVFETDLRTQEVLAVNEVEIKIEYAGLSQEGVAVISGSDYPTSFSHEIYGKITGVGAEVKDLYPGDNVFGFSFDTYATFQRTPSSLVQKADEKHSSKQLATLPMAYCTALYGLDNLEEGSIVLILHGTGASGLAALRVCQWRKAKAFIVVETQAEAEMVKNEYNLTDKQIIFSTVKSIPAHLSELTEGHGADIIFSSGLSNPNIARECWRGIAPFGRFVDFGRKNVLKRSVLDSVPMHRGATYNSFDLLDLYSTKPQALAKLLRLSYELYGQKSITAIEPARTYHLADLDVAVSDFSESFVQGRSLITYEKTDKKLNVLPSLPFLRFRPDATYLLVGALGGLGRSLGSWMMDRGAKHFSFMGRSGTDSKQAAILVDEMRMAGASVQVIRGDAAVRADVDKALKSIPTAHPVRGVVHAAMVLRVSLPCCTPVVNYR